jgi:hypothetical protein
MMEAVLAGAEKRGAADRSDHPRAKAAISMLAAGGWRLAAGCWNY